MTIRCLVLVGLSASGKTTTKDLLVAGGLVRYGVTCTTRAPRPGEVDGKDYDFLTEAEWIYAKDSGALAEETRYVGNSGVHYGILRSRVDDARAELTPTCWILDVNGLGWMRKHFPGQTLAVMLWAGRETLAYRMRQRGDSDETIRARLANYDTELDAGIMAADHVLDTSYQSPEQVAKSVLTLIGV